jgi:sodium transport system permease protein
MSEPSISPGAGSSTWRAAVWLARRDLLEFVRDRRTLFITLLLPMVTYPILALSTVLGLRTATSEIEQQSAPTTIRLALSGPDAQRFADRVRGVFAATAGDGRVGWPQGVVCEVMSARAAAKALDHGEADLWIEAQAGLVTDLDAAGTRTLKVLVPTRREVRPAVREQFSSLMVGVADDARRRRVEAAGLPASLLAPLRLEMPAAPQQGQVSLAKIKTTVAGAVFVLLAVLTMTGAFYPAIDAIAGEKERGTIETLLIAPCSAQGVVFGKFLAVFVVTLATLAANVVSIVATSAVAVRSLVQGAAPTAFASAGATAVAVVAFVGLAAVAAAASLAVTTASKSGKEAQNTLTPLILLASALAGTALLPGMRVDSLMAAAPFAGHVLVANAAVGGDATAAGLPLLPLGVSLVASAALAWLLLQVTAATLTDEDVLFRGTDTTANAFVRPVSRQRPSIVQGVLPIVAGLAALWYSQGFMPADPAWALPLQQLAAVYGPLAAFVCWQRVAIRRTFFLRTASPVAVIGAALLGAGIYVIGVVALAVLANGMLSTAAGDIAARLGGLFHDRPWWVPWIVIAVVPAIGEELLYRGWALSAFAGKMETRRRIVVAVVAQAALFAVAHLLPERMPHTFAVGLALGWVTVVTGSLLPALVGHLVHNSMPLIAMNLFGKPAEGGSVTVLDAVPTWAVAAAIACVVVGYGAVRTSGKRWRDQ